MKLGPKMSFLVEFLSHIDVNGRVIVLADLAELGHDYKAGDMLRTYKELKAVCESWPDKDNQFKTDIHNFITERYLKVRSILGHRAMGNITSITEAEDEENEGGQDKRTKEKQDDETKTKNQKAFKAGAEKLKKSEQSPIAKAVRSKGQTQDDMADSTHVHKSTISRWKTGKRKPSFDNLKKLKSQYGSAVVNQLMGT